MMARLTNDRLSKLVFWFTITALLNLFDIVFTLELVTGEGYEYEMNPFARLLASNGCWVFVAYKVAVLALFVVMELAASRKNFNFAYHSTIFVGGVYLLYAFWNLYLFRLPFLSMG